MSTINESSTILESPTPYEKRLLEAASKGEPCKPDPESNEIPNEIRGEFLRAVLISPQLSVNIHSNGIHLEGATVTGSLNLKNCDIKFPIRLVNCYFHDPIILTGARIVSLDLAGSSVHKIEAARLQVQYSVALCRSEAGDVSKPRLFSAHDEVILSGAVIKGNLYCEGSQFRSTGGNAFSAENIDIGNSFTLRNSSIQGALDITAARIGGSLNCESALLENPGNVTLFAENIDVKGNVFLRNNFISDGELRLLEAHISGSLDCEKASFKNNGGPVFIGDGMRVEGVILFRNFFIAEGEVKLYGVEVNELDCVDGDFRNPGGACFVGSYMNVKRAFKWLGRCTGKVDLQNARVTYLIDDLSAWPEEPGMLNLDGFEYGSLPFEPSIGRNRLKWISLQNPKHDVRAALRLRIDRLYNRFTRDPAKRRKIVYPHIPGTQPYEQLNSVLKKMGLKDDVKTVQVAKNKYITKHSRGMIKIGRWFKSLVDYGYSPYKALIPIVLLILAGSLIFQTAADLKIIVPNETPVNENRPPIFHPLLYSADVFLPIVDIDQQSRWSPDSRRIDGKYVIYYQTFHIMSGWFLTTLFVAAVSGLVKTD
jgi:hypothetical protein